MPKTPTGKWIKSLHDTSVERDRRTAPGSGPRFVRQGGIFERDEPRNENTKAAERKLVNAMRRKQVRNQNKNKK